MNSTLQYYSAPPSAISTDRSNPTSCMTAMGHSRQMRPTTPRRSALEAAYASYVVRVHTRHGIKTLSFDVLAAFFTSTAKKAAEDLGISSRTLIRVCRSLGIRRWPYLGFRSEKNVERIRHEAIDNLRRKLESDASSSPVSVLYPNTASLRGASAKRLLQVKMPQDPNAPTQESHSNAQMQSSSKPSLTVATNLPEACPRWNDAGSKSRRPSYDQQQFVTPPFLTSPHMSANELPSISPKRLNGTEGSMGPSHHFSPSSVCGIPKGSEGSEWEGNKQGDKTNAMPPLNLLVDASLLTSFKNNASSQTPASSRPTPSQADEKSTSRRMSMRDILTTRTA